MTTEYERLGGRLPHDIEQAIKAYAMPRYMKPMPAVIKQIRYLNRNGWEAGGSLGKDNSYIPFMTRALLLHHDRTFKVTRTSFLDKIKSLIVEPSSWHTPVYLT